jgi:hypothetical protein
MPRSNTSTRSDKPPTRRVSFAKVSKLGRALPGVIESTSYGTPALKADGKLTDHYLNYPSILLRLTRVTRPRLKELLEDSWRLVTKEKSRRR